MNVATLLTAPASTLAQMVASRELSTPELVAATLERAQQTQAFEAYLHLDPDGAMKAATALEHARPTFAVLPPLFGLPTAIKDNFATTSMPTTCGSLLLRRYQPNYDAAAVTRLIAHGSVILGKTALDEFAMGSTSCHSALAQPKNPWDPTLVAGGSSGGSAVAVTTGAAACALGSDTGGSVRLPAAFCGLVGFKPSYGRVSRYGLVAHANAFDTVGFLTRTVNDAALMFDACAGVDARDATSIDAYQRSSAQPTSKQQVLRVGLPEPSWWRTADAEIHAAYEDARKDLADRGARLVEVSLPPAAQMLTAYDCLTATQAMSNLARYSGLHFGDTENPGAPAETRLTATRALFGTHVKQRLVWGTYLLTQTKGQQLLARAQAFASALGRRFDALFTTVDLLLLPTTPRLPFLRAAPLANDERWADLFTVAANLAGLPAIAVPRGLSSARLPLSVQLVGRRFDEATLLKTARTLERPCCWHPTLPEGAL